MDLFQIICISLVGIATILHLIACFIENETFKSGKFDTGFLEEFYKNRQGK